MNRREAIAVLTSIPGLKSIERADLSKDDVIVLEVEGSISHEGILRLQQRIESVWPGRKAIVLSDGMKLKVVRESKT